MSNKRNTTHINYLNSIMFCEKYKGMISGGFLFGGGDLTKSPFPLLLAYVSVVNVVTAIFQIILRPFGHFSYVPEILSGIAIGPSFLSGEGIFREELFVPHMGNAVINAFENIGLIIVFFLLSVQIDLSLLKRPGKVAFTIGIAMIVLPFSITIPFASYLRRYTSNEELRETLTHIAALEAATAFQQVLVFLKDLKLLNSQLGRIGLTSSVIAGLGCFVLSSFALQILELNSSVEVRAFVCVQLSQLFMVSFIIFALRPTLLWMMKHTPERETLKESYICCILMMIFGCALFGELTGQHNINGPIILGIATPDSPPMGSSLAHKLGSVAWSVFMPGYTINVGRRVNIYKIGFENVLFVTLTASVATIVKFFSIMIPSLYYKMSFKDALPLCLILTSKGIFDILIYYRAKQFKLIGNDSFTAMVLVSLVHAFIAAPIVRAIYDTSRRYVTYNKRTIQHSKGHCELRMVACVHGQDHVPPIINILEVSNPTKESPLAVYAVYLEEYVGFMPLFISHQYERESSDKLTEGDRINKVFQHYQEQRPEAVAMQCFTSLAPHSSMHDDICTLGHEKSTALVILPYKKSDSPYIRAVNKNVLEYAPCSVAIFFGSGTFLSPNFCNHQSTINACVIFLGGPDDREALAYGIRMAGHPRITLTVVRLIEQEHNTGDLQERRQDEYSINNFKIAIYENESIEYKEEHVAEASETAQLLKFIEEDFDLVLVGRRHDDELPILKGLAEWSEIEEMGVLGDLLVSVGGRGRASVLVVQQQDSATEQFEPVLPVSNTSKVQEFDNKRT